MRMRFCVRTSHKVVFCIVLPRKVLVLTNGNQKKGIFYKNTAGGIDMQQGWFVIKHHTCIAKDVYEMDLSGDTTAITAAGQFVNIRIDGCFASDLQGGRRGNQAPF